jgi:hypothetical protein
VLIRQRLVPFPGDKRRGRKRAKACPAPASPGRIETDGSRAAKGILARYQGHVRSRGALEVGLGWLRSNPFTLQGIGAGAGDGMSSSATRVGFRALHGAGSGLSGRCGFASPERREAQRSIVKSGGAPGSDRLPVCSGFASIAEVGECCRARSGTSSVAADGAVGRASHRVVTASGGDAAAFLDEGVPSSHSSPVPFTWRRGSGRGASEAAGAAVRIGRKRRLTRARYWLLK